MQQEFVSTLNEMSKNAYEAAKSLSELNSKIAEQVLERQMASTKLAVEGGLEQLKLAQESKDVKDYFGKQTALIEQYSAKSMEAAKENVALAQKIGEQYKAWLDVGFAKANDTAKDVSKKVEKAVKKAVPAAA